MKLRIFHSAEGDCLLLQSEDGKNILCDGGRASTMKKHVRKHLAELVDDGSLDYIYVSHVDQDHIHGIQQLLEGLVAAGCMDAGDDGHIHLDVLKVQHHGSEHNMDANFAKRVSADHYVFCGDGSSGNPEPEVIDIIYKSRLGVTSKRALAEKAKDRPFTFWFSSRLENLPLQSSEHANFKKTMNKVEKRQTDSGGLMRVQFVNRDFRTLTV